jgi:GntR family transcriptional regulator, transcriptional repressor for pyruvate dehydrogenase complex
LTDSRSLPGLESLELSRPEAVTTEISRKLLEYLLAGNIQPGEKLPSERRLAESLGIGRSVVREAIKPLALLGLVEVRQGDGTYLKSMESDLLPQVIGWGLLLGTKRTLDLVEARSHLEVVLARLAAERRTEEDLETLRRALTRMHETDDPDEFVASDVDFHLAVAKSAKNETLYQVISSIRSLLRAWMTKVGPSAGLSVSAAEHDPILAAIEAGDGDQAAKTMGIHMAWAVGELEATLSRERPDGLGPM